MELLMQRHRNGERQNELGSFVYIGDMRSYSAWEKAFEELSLDNKPYEEIRSWITEERLALLIFELESFPDSEDMFPSGKWASIQVLQDRIRKSLTSSPSSRFARC